MGHVEVMSTKPHSEGSPLLASALKDPESPTYAQKQSDVWRCVHGLWNQRRAAFMAVMVLFAGIGIGSLPYRTSESCQLRHQKYESKVTGCSYTTKEIVDLIPHINQFYLEIFSGNQNFAFNSRSMLDFTEVFNDIELGEDSESVRFTRRLQHRLHAAMRAPRVTTLERFQLSYALNEVDLFLNLTRLGLFHTAYGVVTENGWVADPTLVTADTAESLPDADYRERLKPTDLVRILSWMHHYVHKVDRMISFYERAIAQNKTHADVTMKRTYQQFYVPALTYNFSRVCHKVTGMRHEEFHGRCLNAADLVMESNRKLKEWYENVYLPACEAIRPNERPGLSHIPDGPEAYQVWLNYHLGFFITPFDVHKIGLQRMETTRGTISELTAMPFDQAALVLSDHNNRTLYICAGENGVTRKDAVGFYSEVRQKLGKYIDTQFSYFPRGQTYFAITGSGGTYWQPGSFDYDRNMWFVSSYFNLGVEGKCGPNGTGEIFERFTAISNVAHEAFPGHGLQVPLQMEIACSLSPYVFGAPTGFVEGWALYTETLPYYMGADEERPEGIYTDPLQKLGAVYNDMLRDNRLVEDTGLHFLGWSFDTALKYMESNGFSAEYADYETYRYVSEPAQAVAYMLGRLRIEEMKNYTRDLLGPKLYSDPEFHTIITKSGGSSLDNLFELVKTYVAVKLDPSGSKHDHRRSFGYDVVADMFSPCAPSVGYRPAGWGKNVFLRARRR